MPPPKREKQLLDAYGKPDMAEALTKEKFIENHSAYFQQIGFDHQFAGCMFYLLDLALEDRMEYESDDDFVIYRKNKDKTIKEYYQVKHSSDPTKKMTDADGDFWKTIDNWVSIYNLIETEEEKNIYFTQGRFVIITNKKLENFLYSLIEKLKLGTVEIDEILSALDDKLKKGPSYCDAINNLKRLGRQTLNEFLHEVEIKYLGDFVQDMYQHFLDIYQAPTKADQIVKRLIGELWSYKLDCNNKFVFTGNDFKRKYKHLFQLVTDENLTLEGFEAEEYAPAEDYENMQMIKQLQSVDVISTPIDKDDYDFVDYIQRFCRFMSAFLSFQRTQLMTSRLEVKIDKAAFGEWKRIFNLHTSKIKTKDKRGETITEEEKIDAGQKVLNSAMMESIPVYGYKTDKDFSNGWYLRMSNMLKVVWHFDWFKKYIDKK